MPKAICANPDYLRIIEEWREELKDRQPGSNMIKVLGKAIQGLKKHPEPLAEIDDLLTVPNVGPFVAKGVKSRLRSNGGLAASQSGAQASTSRTSPTGSQARGNARTSPAKKSRSTNTASKSARNPPSSPTPVPIPRAVPSDGVSRHNLSWNPYESNGRDESLPSRDSVFEFWYLDADDKRVERRDQAKVQIINECQLWYCVEYKKTSSNHPLTAVLIGKRDAPKSHSTVSGGTMTALMSEAEAESYPRCSALPDDRGPAPKVSTTVDTSLATNDLASQLRAESAARRPMTLDPSRQLASLREVSLKRPTVKTNASQPAPSRSSSQTDQMPLRPLNYARPRADTQALSSEADDIYGFSQETLAGPSGQRSSASSQATQSPPAPSRKIQKSVSRSTARRRNAPRTSSHIAPLPALDQELEQHLELLAGRSDLLPLSAPRTFTLPFQPEFLKKGSFDVYLILDSREVKSTKSNRDYISEALKKQKVAVKTRALEVGDVCWIAKERDGPREVVLDFIIERKRIDDLVGSIKDGRFHEQKFRLKQSGLGRIYYIVEEYKENTVHKTMDKSVFTALSSTQVVDEFFLKETRNLDDTVDYLTGLHEAVAEMYKRQDILIIPDNTIRRHSYSDLQANLRRAYPNTIYHTSWDAYRNLNKAGVETVRDCFARMLLCVRNMSAEKVATVIANYETPHALYIAFLNAEYEEERQRAEEEKEGGAASQGKGKGRKKSSIQTADLFLTTLPGNGRARIKDALARQVYSLFRE